MKNNLLTNILIAPNVISKEGVAFIIEHAKRQKKEDLSVFDPDQSNKSGNTKFSVDKKVRDTQMIDLEDIASEIIDLYRNVVTNVINPFYEFEVKDSELPQLLHYGIDGHYMPHCDGESLWKPPGNEPLIWRKSTDRDLSTVLFLNDEFEGGDFVFPELKVRVRPEPGMLVCFPSTHEYLHGVEPVTKGTRYSIVNWMTVKGFPSMEDETNMINHKYNIGIDKPISNKKEKTWLST
jgi:predicted 2-oxoglutarate/Fe(II)-dependent dioxygenase YbiX